MDGKRVRASRTIGVSHISSRSPGLVEADVDVAASIVLACAAGVNRPRTLPVRFSCAWASALLTAAGDGAMMVPARHGGAAVLPEEGVARCAPSDAPRRTHGIALGAPLVMPIWLELDRNGRMSGPSRYTAAASSG